MFRNKRVSPYSPENYSNNEKGKGGGKWWEKYGSASDWAGIIIGGFVAYFTVALFLQTQKATCAAIRAADAADSTYQITKKQFDAAKESGKAADVRADSLLNLQVQALRETQKEFKIGNEPFLEIATPIKLDTLLPNKDIMITTKVRNLGKYPVKIISSVGAIVMRYNKPDFKSIYAKQTTNYIGQINKYIVFDSPEEYTEYKGEPIKTWELVGFFTKSLPIYTYGIYKYKNLVTGETKEYDYMIKLLFVNSGQIATQYIINENKKISN